MKLNVKLFAVARQRIGRESVEVNLQPGATVRELRGALIEQYPPLSDVVAHSRLAINSEFAVEGAAISATAEVAIIPPVSGG